MPETAIRFVVIVAALSVWSADSEDLCLGELSMEGAGSPGYIMGGPPGSVKGGTLTLPHNSGYSIMSGCRQKWEPKEFFQFKVLDRTLSYTVDLSKVGCGCNLALYMVQAPGLDIAGDPSIGECEDSSPYYCDANKVCGQWCPEMDIMEANIKAFQATPHSCDAPSATGHYSNCDRSGCGLSTRDIPNSYGPGYGFQIDTTKPFDVETTWKANNMITKLVQGANVVTLDHSNCGASLGGMAAAMASGMSVRITYWGKDPNTMAWLDSPPCGSEVCSGSNAGNATISNLRITPEMPLQQTVMPTSMETTPVMIPATTTTMATTAMPTTTMTTTAPLPATMSSNIPVLVLSDFLCSFLFGVLFTAALGATISFLVFRILKHWGPFRGLQASTPEDRREPHVQRAVALAVVCMIFALIVAWHPLFPAPSIPVTQDLNQDMNQDTTHGPVTSASPVASEGPKTYGLGSRTKTLFGAGERVTVLVGDKQVASVPAVSSGEYRQELTVLVGDKKVASVPPMSSGEYRQGPDTETLYSAGEHAPVLVGDNQAASKSPVISMLPTATTTATTPQPEVPAPKGCCSWDGGMSCGETTGYCKSAKAHCEKHCNGKWKVGN